MDPEKTFVEVNYALRKQFRGQHLGKKLCQACCEFACEKGFTEIYGETLSYNRASQHILITNGFIPNGIVNLSPETNMKDTYLTKFVKKLNGETDTQCPPKKSGPKPTDLHPDARDFKCVLIDDYQKPNYLKIPAHCHRLNTFLKLREKKNRPYTQKEDRLKISKTKAKQRIEDWLTKTLPRRPRQPKFNWRRSCVRLILSIITWATSCRLWWRCRKNSGKRVGSWPK